MGGRDSSAVVSVVEDNAASNDEPDELGESQETSEDLSESNVDSDVAEQEETHDESVGSPNGPENALPEHPHAHRSATSSSVVVVKVEPPEYSVPDSQEDYRTPESASCGLTSSLNFS